MGTVVTAGVDVTSQLRYMYIVGTVVTAGVDVTSQLRYMYMVGTVVTAGVELLCVCHLTWLLFCSS